MQSRDFVFWLQGFFELTDTTTLTPTQCELIKAHLDLVFKHDPSIPTKQMEHKIPTVQPYIPQPLKKWPDDYQLVSPSDYLTATC